MATAKKQAPTKKPLAKAAGIHSSASKSGAKKTPAKPAKKTVASKTPAKKAPAKTSAKRTPAKSAAKQPSSKKAGSGRKYSPGASQDVEREMRAMKEGKLTIGKSGKKVTNSKQAIAIGLSEARREGKEVPPNPNDGK